MLQDNWQSSGPSKVIKFPLVIDTNMDVPLYDLPDLTYKTVIIYITTKRQGGVRKARSDATNFVHALAEKFPVLPTFTLTFFHSLISSSFGDQKTAAG